MLVDEIGVVLEELLFQHYLQHNITQGTTTTTKILLCLWVHRQICCDKMSSVAIKRYKYYKEIACRPVSNRNLVSLSLKMC